MPKNSGHIRPIILSGGSGTRLWPISRKEYPKQFAKIIGDTCLFAETIKRVANRNIYAAPYIVAGIEHKFFILDILEQLNIDDFELILEPFGKNTAPAAIISALAESEPDLLHLVMPCDHLIADSKAFDTAIMQASSESVDNIILFGMQPKYPETGYGYIIPGDKINSHIYKTKVFYEKPEKQIAENLISQGALWNSGIFLYNPSMMLKEAKIFAANLYTQCKYVAANLQADKYCKQARLINKELYANIEADSFDKAILETSDHIAVLTCQISWSDVGSWYSLMQLADKDINGNNFIGNITAKNVSNSYIRSDSHKIVAIGLEDFLVVASKDATLIAPLKDSQAIKQIYEEISLHNKEITEKSLYKKSPWGEQEKLGEGDNFLVKHIKIKIGESISLQQHQHRAEHWIVIAGVALVECGGEQETVRANQSVFIPMQAKHRLTNIGDCELQIIEVQTGETLCEDDIIRFEDMYGRI